MTCSVCEKARDQLGDEEALCTMLLGREEDEYVQNREIDMYTHKDLI